MKQNGFLEVMLNMILHDVQRTDICTIEKNVYNTLSELGEVEVISIEKEPYDEVYENDANILLKIITETSKYLDDDRILLSSNMFEDDIELLCKEHNYDCTAKIISKNFEAA